MMFIHALVFVLYSGVIVARQREPQCSNYDFAEKTLEKVIRFEHENKLRNEKLKEMENSIKNKMDELGKAVNDKLREIENSLTSFNEFRDVMSKSWKKYKEKTNTILTAQNNQMMKFKDQIKTPTILFKAKDATVSSLSSGDIIVFPNDVTNEGGAYNNKTGVFTAPVNGVYMFTAQFCMKASKTLAVNIVTGDKVISASYFGQDNFNAICYTSDGVTFLEQGDDVMVKAASKHSGSIIYPDGSANYYWTSFSGVLLHE